MEFYESEAFYDYIRKQRTLDYIRYVCYDLITMASHEDCNPRIVKENYGDLKDTCFLDVIEEFMRLVKENRELKAKVKAQVTNED